MKARLRRWHGDADNPFLGALAGLTALPTGTIKAPSYGPDGALWMELTVWDPKSLHGRTVDLYLDDRDSRELLALLKERLIATRSIPEGGPDGQ